MVYAHRRTLKAGFSLIEIMIALAIVALMAAVVGPRVLSFLGRGKVSATESNLKQLNQVVDAYYLNVGKYPQKLEDLIIKPEGMGNAKWGGPYIGRAGEELTEVPKDGWGDDFIYELTGDKRKPYRIYSVNLEEQQAEG